MSTHVPGYSDFLHHFVLTKLATSSIRVKNNTFAYSANEETVTNNR